MVRDHRYHRVVAKLPERRGCPPELGEYPTVEQILNAPSNGSRNRGINDEYSI
jgi:hypothetical protein